VQRVRDRRSKFIKPDSFLFSNVDNYIAAARSALVANVRVYTRESRELAVYETAPMR
jgi:hypothetical protein